MVMFVNQPLEGLNFLKRNIYSASQIMGKMLTNTKLENDTQYTLAELFCMSVSEQCDRCWLVIRSLICINKQIMTII